MSDYPMLISNKLHSFRNFSFTNIQNLKGEVKYFAIYFILIFEIKQGTDD